MKKLVLLFITLVLLVSPMLLSSCAPARWYLVNSEGILTYNRHTGQLELMWSHQSSGANADTTRCPVDSVVHRK